MKRIISFFMTILLLVSPLLPASVALSDSTVAEYFEDGSYLVEGTGKIEGSVQESAGGLLAKIIDFLKRIISLIFKSGSQTVTRTKYMRYYDKNGVILWAVYLKGEFSYDGKSASCTGVDIFCEIYDKDWNEAFAIAEKDGARAIGKFKIRQQKLGVLLKSIERMIMIECDKNGNIV